MDRTPYDGVVGTRVCERRVETSEACWVDTHTQTRDEKVDKTLAEIAKATLRHMHEDNSYGHPARLASAR